MAYNSSGNGNGYHGPNSEAMTHAEQALGVKDHWFRENGRCYDTFRPGRYLFPCDEEEMDRMDIFHKIILVGRQNDSPYGGLHLRPLPYHPRVLDLGCGTGIWAIDMADRYGPQADIQGWDFSLMQPRLIPPGLSFHKRDIEEYWDGVEPDSFDFIHLSMLAGSISNWVNLYRNILGYLKPGSGIMEHVEIDFRPMVEDGELPEGSRLRIWARELVEAMEKAGRPLTVNPNTRSKLEQLGYVEVEHITRRVPFNPWPADAHEQELGRWFNLGMTQGIQALTLAPLARMNGYNKDQVDALVTDVRREICNRNLRAYCTMHIWTARRPAMPGQRA